MNLRVHVALGAALWLGACATPPPPAAEAPPAMPEVASGVTAKTGWQLRRQAVAAANPLAAEAGYRMLRAGGNAIDAAVAVQMVLTLVEPQSSGIGGGAFLLHWDGRQVQAWDGRETAPAEADERLFLQADGQPMPMQQAMVGGRAVGVPGVVRMLEAAHRMHGRLPWAQLLQPAIDLAEAGFAVSPRLHAQLLSDPALRQDPLAAAHFYRADGQPHPVGHVLRNPALAAVLRAIAAQGSAALHQGPVAADIVARVRGHRANPGRLSEADLAGYQPRLREALDTLAAQALQRRGGMPLGEQIAPHFARLALRRDGPAVQPSPLDARLQRLAVRLLRQQLAELQGRNVEDGAIVVLDNASGEPLAWVGAHGDSAAAQVDGVLARRQPGSTLKPFVYGLAFERRLLTPASLLDDSPAEIGTASGAYLPQNYDRRFQGLVSARTALGASLNVPAVRVGAMLPPDALHARLNALGLGLTETAGWYGASLALGSADVTLLALANAYRTLANGGLFAPPALPGTPRAAPRRVMDAAAAFLVTDILADNNARVPTFGLDSSLRTRGFAAVKTGTSKDLRDNWCIGFTDRHTVAVWVGNASGTPMHGVSGVSGAAPIWQALVLALQADRVSRPPAVPAGLQRVRVGYADGLEPSRDEWFLSGTEPRQAIAARRAGPRGGIARPLDGTVYALDPDLPAAVQRIAFEGERGQWWLNGRPIGQGTRLDWSPWPGRHELRLLAADGRELQRVRFEVRGATVARPSAAR